LAGLPAVKIGYLENLVSDISASNWFEGSYGQAVISTLVKAKSRDYRFGSNPQF